MRSGETLMLYEECFQKIRCAAVDDAVKEVERLKNRQLSLPELSEDSWFCFVRKIAILAFRKRFFDYLTAYLMYGYDVPDDWFRANQEELEQVLSCWSLEILQEVIVCIEQ